MPSITMLKKFELSNYKNFKDTLVIDFGKDVYKNINDKKSEMTIWAKYY